MDEQINFEELLKLAMPFIKFLIILIAGHFITVLFIKISKKSLAKTKLDDSFQTFIAKLLNISMHILIILSALNSIGISTTGIMAAMSAAALAVAVSLKDSLSNVAGGILLLVSPRFSTGDFIDAAGNSGTVLSVDLLHTTVRTPDNRQISIPNGVLINSAIINYSKEEKRRVDMEFDIAYEADVNKAVDLIENTIKAHEMVIDKENGILVRVNKYKDSSVSIVSRSWCETANYWNVYFDITEQVKKAFDENNISIPYNQLDVHIKQ